MNKFKAIGLATLSIIVGLTFLYSAWTKILPIQTFEYTLVEYVKMPWLLSAIAARLLIALEAGLGLFMVLNIYGRHKWILKVAAWLLVAFSIYLGYLWYAMGNDINCGCFGDDIWMTPSTSLIKNALLLIATLTLIKYYSGLRFRWATIVVAVLALALLVTPFVIEPLPDTTPTWTMKNNFKLDLSPIYNTGNSDTPKVNLKKGKHVVAFLSLSCGHCRTAALKMHIMKEKNPNLPIYFVIAGNEKYLKDFWQETKAIDIPHTKLDGDTFIAMVGTAWPKIYWMNNEIVEAESNYIVMDQGEIETWLQKP